jgi:hypothetical protein
VVDKALGAKSLAWFLAAVLRRLLMNSEILADFRQHAAHVFEPSANVG